MQIALLAVAPAFPNQAPMIAGALALAATLIVVIVVLAVAFRRRRPGHAPDAQPPAAQANKPPNGASTKVFISYSRKDASFVSRLASALEARGYAPVFDQSRRPHEDMDLRLTPQDEWWAALKTMIAACDVMVFVVTPDSASSPVCDDEIAHARALGKRVVAVLRKKIDFEAAPERLRALNVQIDFRDEAERAFSTELEVFFSTLDLDVDWHRAGGRLMRLANHWDRAGRTAEHLLRSGAIADADAWASRRPSGASPPGELLVAFLDASRAYEREQRDRQRRIIGRAFVKPALAALNDGAYDHALRLAATGALLADDTGFKEVPELWDPFARAARASRTRSVLLGHTDCVITCAFNPDATRIVTISKDNSARVWSTQSGECIAVLKGQLNPRSHILFRNDGRAVTVAENGTPNAWNIETGDGDDLKLTQPKRVKSVSIRTRGDRMIAAGIVGARLYWDGADRDVVEFDGEPSRFPMQEGKRTSAIRTWDIETGEELRSPILMPKEAQSICFSPDDKLILARNNDGKARLLDAETAEVIHELAGHNGNLTSAIFSPDGLRVLTTSIDHTAIVWDARSGQKIAILAGHDSTVWSASFSPSGQLVATASHDAASRLWDAESGELIAVLKSHEGAVRAAQFAPDGRTLVTVSDDTTVRIWNTQRDAPQIAVFAPDGELRDVAYRSDGRQIISAAADGVAAVWETDGSSAEGIKLAHDRQVMSARFSPDGKWIATACFDTTVRVWPSSGDRTPTVLAGHTGVAGHVVFSPDSQVLATSSWDYSARLWRKSRDDVWREHCVLRAQKNTVNEPAFSPDGRLLATCSNDGEVCIWNVADGAQLHLFHPSRQSAETVCFSPDGALVMSASKDGAARLWDTASGAGLLVIEGDRPLTDARFGPDGNFILTADDRDAIRVWKRTGPDQPWAEALRIRVPDERLSGASFSPDGTRIMTESHSGPTRIWSTSTGREIAILAHKHGVRKAVFSPDGQQVAIAHSDGKVRLWDVSRTSRQTGDRASFLAAALSDGLGQRTSGETQDLLMQDAPADLHSEALSRLTPEQAAQVIDTTQAMRGDLHPNCYLSPSAFGKIFPDIPVNW